MKSRPRALIKRASACTPRQGRAPDRCPFAAPAPRQYRRLRAEPRCCRAQRARKVARPLRAGVCTWGCRGLMDFNTCKQELLLAGTKAAPGAGLSPTLLALFPLRCFLSPSLSEFNEDNEISQAHFALQQLSNTSLTREKEQERSGAQRRSHPRRLRPRGQIPASPGPGQVRSAAGAEPGCGADPGLRGGGSAPLHRPGSAPSSPAPAPRRGSLKKND